MLRRNIDLLNGDGRATGVTCWLLGWPARASNNTFPRKTGSNQILADFFEGFSWARIFIENFAGISSSVGEFGAKNFGRLAWE